jgi:hypothetical protein
MVLTRQERERLVLELYYNQGKTIREIAKAGPKEMAWDYQTVSLKVRHNHRRMNNK